MYPVFSPFFTWKVSYLWYQVLFSKKIQIFAISGQRRIDVLFEEKSFNSNGILIKTSVIGSFLNWVVWECMFFQVILLVALFFSDFRKPCLVEFFLPKIMTRIISLTKIDIWRSPRCSFFEHICKLRLRYLRYLKHSERPCFIL